MPSAHPKGLLGHFPHRPTPSCICNQGRSGDGGWAVVLWLRNKLSLGSEHARTFRSGPQDRENQSEDNHTSLLSPQHSEVLWFPSGAHSNNILSFPVLLQNVLRLLPK